MFLLTRSQFVDTLFSAADRGRCLLIAFNFPFDVSRGSGSLLAQTYNTIYIFGAGGSPRGTLVEGTDGNLYGTTYGGGVVGGMIFKITPGGTFSTLVRNARQPPTRRLEK